jgi:curved DNA-binding protein CbpA
MSEANLERLLAWAALVEESSYYEILDVPRSAESSAVKAAFHAFALAFHPDGHAGTSQAQRDAARRVFHRGAEAYRVLADPDLRAEYDLALARGHLRLDATAPESPAANGVLMSLEDVCRTPGAKLLGRRADQKIGQDDLVGGRRLLAEALATDGGDNPELEQRIEALDLAIFARGG